MGKQKRRGGRTKGGQGREDRRCGYKLGRVPPGGLLLGGGSMALPVGLLSVFQSTGSTVRPVSNMEVSSDVTVPEVGCLKTSLPCNKIRGTRKGKTSLSHVLSRKKSTLYFFFFENKI